MTSSVEPICSQFAPVLEDPLGNYEHLELWSIVQSGFPTHSPSGSETSQYEVVLPSHSNSTSGSEATRPVYTVEERKRRRMISNRESARRSRLRKKQQLEDLTNQTNRLKDENRKLKNRLCLLRQQYHAVQMDSTRLMAESIDLQHKLAGLNQILVNMHLQESALTSSKSIELRNSTL